MYMMKRPKIIAYTVATVQPGNCKYGKVAYGLHVYTGTLPKLTTAGALLRLLLTIVGATNAENSKKGSKLIVLQKCSISEWKHFYEIECNES